MIRPAALAFRLAWRELRAGLGGFAVFIACLAIGVGAIAAVGTTARSLTGAMNREGRTILGGDLSLSRVARPPSAAERAAVAALGPVTEAATLRAMARRADRSDQVLTELKAVDGAYPLVGTLDLEPPLPPDQALARRGDVWGATAEPALMARLGLSVGDRIVLGAATFEIRAVLRGEPDKLAGGVGFGPRLLVSLDALAATALVQPGSLVRHHLRVAAPALTDDGLRVAGEAFQRRFPDGTWEARTRANASPQLTRSIEQFTQFLALVGLSALVVGGVGVANAVRHHIDGRRATIATMKAVGATGRFVVLVYLVETAMVAALGIAVGVLIGLALPAAALWLFGALLPIPVTVGFFPGALLLAAAYGALIALAFALWPLGRAHDISVRALYREAAADPRGRPRIPYLVALAASLALLVALATLFTTDRRLALLYAGATALAFVLLRLVAAGLMALARRVPRPRSTGWRLALANIHRPGALTPTVVLSLGLGLTLLVAIALVDGNLRRQLTSVLPERAPNFYFLDVPSDELDGFRALASREAPDGRLEVVPMLRGRILSLKGVPAESYPAPPGAAWVLNGDRGITYAATVPANSALVDGAWWAADYDGPPLVSFEARLAEELGLRAGDAVEVNVLGRVIAATIANTRSVRWESLGINFVLVFSPSTFSGAPHTLLATLTLPDGAGEAGERGILREVSEEFPTVATIRVKEALDTVNRLVGQLAAAVAGASGVALVAAVLVLGGALAAGHRSRILDAVILKTLGATRGRLVAAFALEYALLGLATALFGLAAGWAIAWFVVTRLMDLAFVPLPGVAFAALGGGLLLTLLLGLAGTWRVLRHRPAPVLRSL